MFQNNANFTNFESSKTTSSQEFLLRTDPEMGFMVNLANSVFSLEIVGAAVDISSVRKSKTAVESMVAIMFSAVS